MTKERPFFRYTMRRDVKSLSDQQLPKVLAHTVLGPDAKPDEIVGAKKVVQALFGEPVELDEATGTEFGRDLGRIWVEEVVGEAVRRIVGVEEVDG